MKNENSLLRGWDYQGNLCKAGNPNGKFNAWADISSSHKVRICVHDCDETETSSKIVTHYASKTCMFFNFVVGCI